MTDSPAVNQASILHIIYSLSVLKRNIFCGLPSWRYISAALVIVAQELAGTDVAHFCKISLAVLLLASSNSIVNSSCVGFPKSAALM